MKRIVTSGLLIVILGFSSAAQKNKEILVTIGETAVTLPDFMRIYERNNANIQDPANKKSPADYLQLYINFKLKVQEALHLKLDTATAFRSELAGYRSELAAPYLTDIAWNEKGVEETYHRMKEVNANSYHDSHSRRSISGRYPDSLEPYAQHQEEILNDLISTRRLPNTPRIPVPNQPGRSG